MKIFHTLVIKNILLRRLVDCIKISCSTDVSITYSIVFRYKKLINFILFISRYIKWIKYRTIKP